MVTVVCGKPTAVQRRAKDTDFSRWQLDDIRESRKRGGIRRTRRTKGEKIEEKGGERREEEEEEEEKEEKKRSRREIWAVLGGASAYPIGYASVTATFTMSGYTRPRTSLERLYVWVYTLLHLHCRSLFFEYVPVSSLENSVHLPFLRFETFVKDTREFHQRI